MSRVRYTCPATSSNIARLTHACLTPSVLGHLGIDEPTDSDNPALLQHIFTTNQPETFQVLREWRELVDKYHEK
ncbi:hypothetical protein E2C01_052964 [Portunus trituberculatus]|uniref:Uncharacterized protein n=1 Tax=Portunus trituberculatus TaxID=210409 RepID=A0A5B7GFX0_PORTR|nr:hypothetical protein [Portunus trituberculatus]